MEEFRALTSEYAQGKWRIEDFQVDFDSLFRVPGSRYVHPYESVYRQQETTSRKPHKSMLMGKEALQVSEIYRKEGLSPAESTAVFPDELGVELEFMGHLCSRTAAALEKNQPGRAADLIRVQREFFTGHLSRWCFPCLDKVMLHAETPLYRLFARLLIGYLREEQITVSKE
ncbi:MAG: molecular chaperone TorD family protein [Deltaproteobacteria bacterium]|nr:molecular chaperone TorD family protein [Deltaproteobacteria bacterium]